jgi:hypothetical protein
MPSIGIRQAGFSPARSSEVPPGFPGGFSFVNQRPVCAFTSSTMRDSRTPFDVQCVYSAASVIGRADASTVVKMLVTPVASAARATLITESCTSYESALGLPCVSPQFKYLLMATPPSRRRTRSVLLPMVCVAGSDVETGMASESYAARSAVQARSSGTPTLPPIGPPSVGCVSTDIDPSPPPPETRTVSSGTDAPGAEFDEAHPASNRHETTVVRRIARLPGKGDGTIRLREPHVQLARHLTGL